ncbi:MAG: methionyl-tRNA formyltransferase [Oscillospiraceae bacterium]|nr:methionyl-tRNA formyltransferase [Oscillospiraceae bacterium]
MGTPDFAAESLKALIEDKNCEVAGVFTQPDRPCGRGMSMIFSPVKQLALDNGIPVFQPMKMRDGTAAAIVKDIDPDIIVVVAFGRILPDEIIYYPKYGSVNIHASLLPKYRGSSPIQWSVINGDEVTGVTSMYMATEMDTGDIIYSVETPIGEFETSGELSERLKVMGAELLIRTLRDIEAGKAPRISQDESKATYVSMLDKSICPIEWCEPARKIIKKIYGLQPWPVAVTVLGEKELKIFSADYGLNADGAEPGTVIKADSNGIEVACGSGESVIIKELQAPGKKRMSASAYLNGCRITAGVDKCR